MKTLIYDTTLRDGTQGENINFSPQEKIKLASEMDKAGFDYIEGGWPGSNPRDKEFFELAKKEKFRHAKLTAFGSTCRKKIKPEDDANLAELIKSETPAVTIFGKTWDLHIEKVMNNTLKENLRMIFESVKFLKENNREVIYDAEHFFDGYKDNPDYALDTLKKAREAGAGFLTLCDTNGGSLPSEIRDIIKKVKEVLPEARLGIHTHNDSGLAVANTLEAVDAGAEMAQGTLNGYGERCGNADLTAIIPNLELKMNKKTIGKNNLDKLKHLSMFASELANLTPVHSRPFVGKSAFAHKGGIHVSAVRRDTRSYEHINPELVGNRRRILISDLAGKSNIEHKAEEMGIDLSGIEIDSADLVKKIKELENKGYQFDVADASFDLYLKKISKKFKPKFELIKFKVSSDKLQGRQCLSMATVKLRVGDEEKLSSAEGNGPVNALDNALRKALLKYFPELARMHLSDFKVRVIDGQTGTGAKVRVLIESRDAEKSWTTVGASRDVLEAAWQALEDGVNYYLDFISD